MIRREAQRNRLDICGKTPRPVKTSQTGLFEGIPEALFDFDLDEEASLGTCSSAFRFLLSAQLLLIQWRHVKATGHWVTPLWLMLAIQTEIER